MPPVDGSDDKQHPERTVTQQENEYDGWSNKRYEILYQDTKDQIDIQTAFAADYSEHVFQLLSIELTLLAAIVAAIEADLINISFPTFAISLIFFSGSIFLFVLMTAQIGGVKWVSGRPVVWIGPDKEDIISLMYHKNGGKQEVSSQNDRGEKTQYQDFHSDDSDRMWDEYLLLKMASKLEDNRNTLRRAGRTYTLGILLFIFGVISFVIVIVTVNT